MANSELPKRRSAADRAKISVYVDREIFDLYNRGKANGYDTPEIARRAVDEALRKASEKLKTPA